MRDLPALWSSAAWRAELEAWLLPALADAGLTPTGPVVQDRVRFWSTVLHVDTDDGRVWVKENAPSQAFEAALVTVVDRIAPGRMAPVVAAEADHGWLATRDVGVPLWDRDDVGEDAWVELVAGWGRLQRELAPHADALLATGMAAFPEDAAAGWAADLADTLYALPTGDPRRLSDGERREVDAGLPLVADAAEALVASGMPATLQHNDLHLGNAFHEAGSPVAFIDLGDAVWAHPFTAFRIPLWILAERQGGAGDPLVGRVVDAALEPWTDLASRDALRALLPSADRVSCLHRALSWQRLVDDVPVSAVDPGHVRAAADWLLVATDTDPFARATR
ncbi:phosphotransferase [Phycicoccus sp. CSK15P-2]|uniref:phosphotransferase n=1 Tax=Phycicoccus sp. CSK15P-2 TaxID=2807627 RepID=UPI00194E875B|nr:phosphotransferase [Phycicoccus sp. CSK15P-2]MBM6404844.1 phosphotransferase [Phycicoccus sp. CSK15P-2]